MVLMHPELKIFMRPIAWMLPQNVGIGQLTQPKVNTCELRLQDMRANMNFRHHGKLSHGRHQAATAAKAKGAGVIIANAKCYGSRLRVLAQY